MTKQEPLARVQDTRGFDLTLLQPLGLVLCEAYGALATIVVILLAVAGKAAGDATDAAAGQRIMIALGLSAGWIKTISIVSPDALMAPCARGVVG